MSARWLAVLVLGSGCLPFEEAYRQFTVARDSFDGGRADGGGPDCNAGQTVCGQECVDLDSSTTHCGACGADCGGGSCRAGECRPVTLLPNLAGAHDIAVLPDAVYVSQSEFNCPAADCATNRVFRVEKTLSGSTELIASGQLAIQRIALHRGRLWFTTWPTNLASRFGSVLNGRIDDHGWGDGAYFGLTVSGDEVIACQFGSSDAGGLSVLYRTSFEDGGAVRTRRQVLDQAGCTNLAPLANGAVVAAHQNSDAVVVHERDGAALTLIAGLADPWGVAVSGDFVFFSEQSGGRLRMANLRDGGVTVLARNLETPRDVAFDGTWLYFTEHTQRGSVSRLRPFGDGGIQVVAAGQALPVFVRLDGDFIYWTNFGFGNATGSLNRIRKPRD